MYINLQEVLLKASNRHDYSNKFQTVTDFYGDDFDAAQLCTQLQLLTEHFRSVPVGNDKVRFKEIVEFLQSLSTPQHTFYSQVVILVSLVLVMPATNAASERSFSSLRRIKTYLRSTITQSRLNSIMLLQVHRDLTDQINLIDVANDFVDNKLDHRSTIFGRFTELELNNICVCSACSKVLKCMQCTK